jgi:hypothetical protein
MIEKGEEQHPSSNPKPSRELLLIVQNGTFIEN